TVIKKFLDSKNCGSEALLRLAQTYNIHLLKDIPDDKEKILLKICDYNSNFKSFVNYLPKLEIEFNIDSELTPSFNIPYYLSVILADKRNDNENKDYSEEANEILMSILFKVFNCSGDDDKELFLKNKDNTFRKFNRSIKHSLNGFSITNKESLYDRTKYAGLIIDNFIHYDLNQINHIVRSTRSEKEILKLFDHFMTRKNGVSLKDWRENTNKLSDKIYFLYCYHKYDWTHLDTLYQKLNSNEKYKVIEDNREKIEKDYATNKSTFHSIEINYLQHNQVGKSLITAETARRIVVANGYDQKHKVFVITCYNHLAKRDHKNYQKYYEHFGIKTMYCSSESSTKEFSDKNVIHTDLETYFGVLRNEGYNTLKNRESSIKLPEITNAVLIMEEFDNLILDLDEHLQYVHDFDVKTLDPNANFNRKEDFEKLFV
ncbi:unnamed protein product, partial [Didymodactylos carnosus]